MEELQFINELKSGDQAAFKRLVAQLSSRVYNTCLGLLQNSEDAEDITQEVFISVFQNISQFKGDARLSTWIYKIAVTRSLEHIRSQKRKKRFAFMQSLFNNEGEIKKELPHFHHPGVLLENKERAAVLFKAIDQLAENQKTAFILHKTEDLSYAEISEIMNTSVSSVESLMFRAKQNLQKILGEYYKENEK